MQSGMQVWSGEVDNKLLVDVTGRMLNIVGSFRVPIYIYWTDGWDNRHEIPQQIISGSYALPKILKGDVIFIPSYDDPTFISMIRGPIATRQNYQYNSGERSYVPPDCVLSDGNVNWSFDFRRILPSGDSSCIAIGGFTVNVGFY